LTPFGQRGGAVLLEDVAAVAGFTITSISRQFGMSRDRSTQSRRSVGRSEGRREVLFIVAS